MNISFNVNNSNFDHGSSVVKSIHQNGDSSGQADAILTELQEIRMKLTEANDLSQSLLDLEIALKNQDKPTIARIVGQLSSNFSSSLLANLASSGLSAFLGLI